MLFEASPIEIDESAMWPRRAVLECDRLAGSEPPIVSDGRGRSGQRGSGKGVGLAWSGVGWVVARRVACAGGAASARAPTLWVSQFVPSTLHWAAGGVSVHLAADLAPAACDALVVTLRLAPRAGA